jgi:O-antigen/teichoic acid export membrane protein
VNFLAAVGRIKTTSKLMLMWTILTWVLVPVAAAKFGVNGAAVAYAVVGTSSIVVFFMVKKIVNWSIYHAVLVPLISALIMGLGVGAIKMVFPVGSLMRLLILIAAGILIYGTTLYLFLGPSLMNDAKKLWANIIKR